MRLGIDFGTTRVVVSVVDRGNYPVVTFDGVDGESRDWFPPLLAVQGNRREYGWNAWSAQAEGGWSVVRSLKRALEDAGPGTTLHLDDGPVPLLEVLVEMVAALRRDLTERSSVAPIPASEPLQVMLGVPANANSNQRFLTVEAFRRAGFQVMGLLNEPSAASIEFGHRQRVDASDVPLDPGQSGRVLVYDLGGGTFDISLVQMDRRTHSVLASDGVPTLGGDDFDGVLADLAWEMAGPATPARDSLTQAEEFRLHEECRVKKEALHPNTRKIVVDLESVREGLGQVSVPATAFYERCRPLIAETMHAVQDLLSRHGYAADGHRDPSQPELPRLEAVYVTGGGAEMPQVARVLREQFGRRVRRSAHTRAATAIGLAIQADEQAGYVLREQFTRFFGVWREAEGGSRLVFDPLFPKGTALPGPSEPPLQSQRTYCPVHNVGHFRFLECGQRADDGRPHGDIAIWDEIQFPFDPALQAEAALEAVPVTHSKPVQSQTIEERYSCDASGTVVVTITNRSTGYSREYRLGRWAGNDTPVSPTRRKRAAKK